MLVSDIFFANHNLMPSIWVNGNKDLCKYDTLRYKEMYKMEEEHTEDVLKEGV